jgi:hypothetical protein
VNLPPITHHVSRIGMLASKDRQILVIDLGGRDRAACELRQRADAKALGLSFFTPCTLADSLLEAVAEAAKTQRLATTFYFHPLVRALISFRTISNAVKGFVRPLNQLVGAGRTPTPIPMVEKRQAETEKEQHQKMQLFAPWFFEGKPRRERTHNLHLTERTPPGAKRK